MKNWNNISKEQVIKTIQSYMTDSEGTKDYLETLTKDELKTTLIQLITH